LSKRGWYKPVGDLNLALDQFEQTLKLTEQKFNAKMAEYVAQSGPASCKRGCAACCRQQVLSTVPEGLVIARHLLVYYKPQQILDLIKTLSGHASMQEHMSAAEWFDDGEMCPFLNPEDDDCTIYVVRPAMCRFYHSFSPFEDCSKPSGTEVLTPDTAEAESWVLRASMAFMTSVGERPMMTPGYLPTNLLLGLTVLQDNSFDAVKEFTRPMSHEDAVALFKDSRSKIK
jgi:Fe-S-cluster containining protein